MGSVSEDSPQVLNETLYLRRPDPKDPQQWVKLPLDTDRLLREHQLEAVELDAEELDAYVGLAIELDDGEAACLAVAQHRHWTIATDDAIARRIARELEVPVLETTDHVYQWANTTAAPRDEVEVVVANIRHVARFTPRSAAPHAKWWADHFSG